MRYDNIYIYIYLRVWISEATRSNRYVWICVYGHDWNTLSRVINWACSRNEKITTTTNNKINKTSTNNTHINEKEKENNWNETRERKITNKYQTLTKIYHNRVAKRRIKNERMERANAYNIVSDTINSSMNHSNSILSIWWFHIQIKCQPINHVFCVFCHCLFVAICSLLLLLWLWFLCGKIHQFHWETIGCRRRS